MADSSNGSNEPQVTFTIKNPSKHEADAFKLTVPLSATLADIQRRITAEYDGNPPPQSQTLIYAGKVLKEPTLAVKDIVQQTALSDGSYAHSMHLVVRAASVGGAPSTSATPKPAVQAGSSAGTSSGGTAQPAAAAAAPTSQEGIAGQAPAAVAQAVETAPSFDSHRSDPSSAGGSSAGGSSSGQYEEGASDGGGMPVGPGAMPHFGAPAGLSPMFVFGTHGSSNGLLYTGHGPAGHLGLSGPYTGFSQPGVLGNGGPTTPGAATMAAGIQHVPYPYMMNLMNPLMNNPVMATAYQAAYSAALQSMQQQQASTAAAGAAAANTAAGAGTSTGGADPSSSAAAAGGQAAGVPPAAVPHPHTPLMPLTAPLAPAALLYYPAVFQQAAMAAAAHAAAAASHNQHGGQQQQAHAGFGAAAGPFPLAAPFAVPLVGIPAHLAAGQAAVAAQQAAGAAAAAGGGARAAGAVRVGLRQRFPHGFAMAPRPAGARQQQQGQQAAGAPAAAVAAPGAAGAAAQPHGNRRYRTRTITFRISMRTLLQMLVFAMVLYQHCTWPRLCILLFGSIILYITALWPPFRQFVVSLARPPLPEQLAQMRQRREQAAAAAAAGQPPPEQQAAAAEQPAGGGAPAAAAAAAPQGQAAAAGGAEAAAAPAAAPGAQQQAVGGGGVAAGVGAGHPPGQPPLPAWLQQGLLREVLAVLVSFITSLFPAWNYNAEDAAVFAAAQEMLAREEQQQRQGQAQGQGQPAAGGNGVFP